MRWDRSYSYNSGLSSFTIVGDFYGEWGNGGRRLGGKDHESSLNMLNLRCLRDIQVKMTKMLCKHTHTHTPQRKHTNECKSKTSIKISD